MSHGLIITRGSHGSSSWGLAAMFLFFWFPWCFWFGKVLFFHCFCHFSLFRNPCEPFVKISTCRADLRRTYECSCSTMTARHCSFLHNLINYLSSKLRNAAHEQYFRILVFLRALMIRHTLWFGNTKLCTNSQNSILLLTDSLSSAIVSTFSSMLPKCTSNSKVGFIKARLKR